MSNDLISRSAVMESIKRHSYPVSQRNNSIENGMTLTGIQQCVDEEPTAYDVDKVVEQLENIKTDNSCKDCKYRDKCDELQNFYNPDDNVDLCGLTIKHLAIEIVKAGGVSDNH